MFWVIMSDSNTGTGNLEVCSVLGLTMRIIRGVRVYTCAVLGGGENN